ncbi:MAG: hypothetical protein KDC84_15975, partial [Crocinitomicaceae bacterium]|nr:hypothetical protein [Crocinitomicaceae bacterium]
MRIGLFFIVYLYFFHSFSQSETTIHVSFEAQWDGEKLANESQYFGKDSIQISEFRFYVSNLVFEREGTGFMEQESFHLVDIFGQNNFDVNFPPFFKFDTLEFYLGIDSITNVAGVMGGDLDPTKGMYWTWQSGYINLKLEGKSPKSPTSKNEFQYHLGGY